MTLSLVPIRDDKRLMDDAIPFDDATKEVFVSEFLDCFRHACRNDEWSEYRKFLSKFTNIPRHMKLSRHNIKKDEWFLDLAGLRDQSKVTDNQTVASFYHDGGKIEHKVAPYTPIKLVEGSVIEWRPPPQYRLERFSRNLKFMVVADDGVEEEEEEEEEAENVVVADAVDADDGVEEEAEVVPVVPVVDAGVVNADDEDEEAVEVVPAVSRLEQIKEEEISYRYYCRPIGCRCVVVVVLIYVYVRSCFHLNFYYNTIQYPHTLTLCIYYFVICIYYYVVLFYRFFRKIQKLLSSTKSFLLLLTKKRRKKKLKSFLLLL